MKFDNIYKDVVDSFGGLWNFKERGDSLEIITPFATTSHRFVSIFLTKKNDEYIVSDGGWIDEGGYDNSFERGIDCYAKIINHYKTNFDVKETYNHTGISFFYKKTNKQISVPSLIFDMANFVSSIVSLSAVEYETEKGTRDLFRKSANEYLTQIFNENLIMNEFLDTKTHRVKPSAIIKRNNGKVLILNYITGSTDHHFNNSIGKTNIIFELASKSKENIMIEKKIALIDDTAQGYIPNKISTFLNHLIDNTHSKSVNWTGKEELMTI